MRKKSFNRNLLTLISGLLVFVLPLLFVRYLSEKIVSRSRETASSLLKEKVLQEVENFKARLSPETYVKHIITKVHTKLLPEITPDVFKLYPDESFGDNEFNSELPAKFARELIAQDLSPLFFVCNPSGFSSTYFWGSEELKNQAGNDTEDIALAFAYELLRIASKIYYINYNKAWNKPSIGSLGLRQILRFISSKDQIFNHYISRFTDLSVAYDDVYPIYTDYFSRQYLYGYSLACISQVNIHGGYSLLVEGNSIAPEKIVSFAEKNPEQQGVRCKVSNTSSSVPRGISETPSGITFCGYLPGLFFGHKVNWDNDKNLKRNSNEHKLRIIVSADFPREFFALQRLHSAIKATTTGCFLILLMLAAHISLFGVNLRVRMHKKLLIVVSIIFLLPVLATGIVSYYLFTGFDRLLELHLGTRVENKLQHFMRMEDEKRSRLQAKNLQIKHFYQTSDYPASKLVNLHSSPPNFPDIFKCICNFAIMNQDTTLSDHRTGGSSDHKLTQGLLGKFLQNQGISKASMDKIRSLELKISLTMGLMENFLTPEIEESIIPREGTIQREITHSIDTNLACFMVCARDNGESMLIFSKTNNFEAGMYDFFIRLNVNDSKVFNDQTSLYDIKSGIRLRKHGIFTNYAWPNTTVFDKEMLPFFEKALAQRSSGSKKTRNDSGLKYCAWAFREGHQGIFVTIGTTRKTNDINLAISLIFPISTTYSIILLILISNVLSGLFVRPLDHLKTAIEEINQNRFGVIIEDIEVTELKKVSNAFNEMSIALKQKQLISRYVSDRLIASIESKSNCLSNDIEEHEVTVLASDIRSFTNITESYQPFEVVEMLNSYFTLMEKAIDENHGFIDKFVGDAIQAIFYPAPNLPSTSDRAINAAMEMRNKLLKFNSERQLNQQFAIENGIGIATGKIVSGTIGNETGRKIFLVTGDPTQLAAHLESLSVKTDSKIVLCEKTVSSCDQKIDCQSIDEAIYELKRAKL